MCMTFPLLSLLVMKIEIKMIGKRMIKLKVENHPKYYRAIFTNLAST